MQKNFVFPKKINSIQCLRFFAALAVAFHHFGIVASTENTVFDVTFFLRWFFTISGFIVMLSTQKEEKRNGFFCRRLIRLVPLYWLLTVMAFAAARFIPDLLGYVPSVGQLIKSMFFIPFSRESLKSGITLRPIVGLGHTLQMELAFSLVFAISMRISHKYRGLISGGVIVVLALIGKCFTFNNDFCKFYLEENYLAWLSFGIGVASYGFLCWMRSCKADNRLLLAVSGTVAIIAAVMAHVLFVYTDRSFLIYMVNYVIFLSVIVCASAYSSLDLPTPRLIVVLGDASFSFYLIHYFVISIAERVLHINSFSILHMNFMVLAVVASWGISYISYYIVETRFGGWLVQRLNKATEASRAWP